MSDSDKAPCPSSSTQDQTPQPPQANVAVIRHLDVQGELPKTGVQTPEAVSNPPPLAARWWKFWRGPPETVLARATVLLAIATLILAAIAGIQAWILATTDASTRDAARAAIKSASTAEDVLKTARENFRTEQRPIIWLTNDLGTPNFIKLADKATGQILWEWHYTNYGKTPALQVSFHDWFIMENKKEESYGGNATAVPGAPLPTGKDDRHTVVSHPGISPEDFNTLMRTDQAIGISGEITYYDAYGQKYATTFCLSHLALGGISYCSEGNDIK